MRGSIKEVVKGAVYELLWDGPRKADGGRNRKHRRYNGTRRQAEAELARVVAGAATEPEAAQVALTRYTVEQWIDVWLTDTERMKRTGSQALGSYHTHLGAVKRGLGSAKLEELTPMMIRSYYAGALADGRQIARDKNGAGLSKQTVKHQHTALKAALEVAVLEGILTRNPAKDPRAAPPEPEGRPMPSLEVDQVKTLLDAVEGGSLWVPVVLALGAGLRLGEVLALQWDAVRFESNILWVNKGLVRVKGGLEFKEPKRNSKRPIVMPAFLVEALKRHQTKQAELKTLMGAAWKDNNLVVPMEDGRPTRHEYLSGAFGQLMDTMGWPEVTFHSLRCTHSSLLAYLQASPKVVQERLGHRNYETTHKHYSVVLRGMHQQAADDLDALLSPRRGLIQPDQEHPEA